MDRVGREGKIRGGKGMAGSGGKGRVEEGRGTGSGGKERMG
jgi:hypothetical protein